MTKAGIDQEALINSFSQATKKQGEAIRKAVTEATLKAMQQRELTLKNIRSVLGAVSQAAAQGVAKNTGSKVDLDAILTKAVDGMDAALLKAVEANQRALEQFVEQGANLRDKRLKSAISDLERMEKVLITAVSKVATDAGEPVKAGWEQVLSSMKQKGTETGANATRVVDKLLNDAHESVQDGRAMGLRAAESLMDGYSSLVSGVLIGMSDGIQGSANSPKPASRARRGK